MVLNLYGHPTAGFNWQDHAEEIVLNEGFVRVSKNAWVSVFYHPQLRVVLVIYVDDFKCTGVKAMVDQAWQKLRKKIKVHDKQAPSRICDIGRSRGNPSASTATRFVQGPAPTGQHGIRRKAVDPNHKVATAKIAGLHDKLTDDFAVAHWIATRSFSRSHKASGSESLAAIRERVRAKMN